MSGSFFLGFLEKYFRIFEIWDGSEQGIGNILMRRSHIGQFFSYSRFMGTKFSRGVTPPHGAPPVADQ
jgi:hypothetical protein